MWSSSAFTSSSVIFRVNSLHIRTHAHGLGHSRESIEVGLFRSLIGDLMLAFGCHCVHQQDRSAFVWAVNRFETSLSWESRRVRCRTDL